MDAPPLALNAWLRWDLIDLHLGALGEPASVLELGMGQGAVGARLAARTTAYTGVEPDATSRAVAAGRMRAGARVLDGLDALVDGDTYDLVCAFEVLEHLEDDADVLAEWAARVAPGGHLMLSVPAHQRRFGAWDTRAGHLRRYGRQQLRDLFEGAGLEVVAVDASGYPLGNVLERVRNTIARLERRRGSAKELTAESGRAYQPPAWTAAVMAGVSAPFRAVQRRFRRSERGTGWVAVARKPAA